MTDRKYTAVAVASIVVGTVVLFVIITMAMRV